MKVSLIKTDDKTTTFEGVERVAISRQDYVMIDYKPKKTPFNEEVKCDDIKFMEVWEDRKDYISLIMSVVDEVHIKYAKSHTVKESAAHSVVMMNIIETVKRKLF